MKIQLISHASILVETANCSIVSDPWWRGPCFGAQWWLYPPARTDLLDYASTDYVYVSHGHHDHFHPGTLRLFDRNTKFVTSSTIDLAEPIRDLGFPVVTVDPDEKLALSDDLSIEIWPTHGSDTLALLSSGDTICANLNDALHSAPLEVRNHFSQLLRDRFAGTTSYMFCGFGTASHFPNCYEIPNKNEVKTAERRQAYFSDIWTDIVNSTSPNYAFPFAADVLLLEEELQGVNEAIHNKNRPAELFTKKYPSSPVTVADIAPGTCVEAPDTLNVVPKEHLSMQLVREQMGKEIDRANTYHSVTEQQVDELIALVRENLELCQQHLETFEGDYAIRVSLRGSNHAISIAKRGKSIDIKREDETFVDYDLEYRVRLPYLRLSLTEKYGDEILFVGSGGVFRYVRADDVQRMIHVELRTLITRQTQPLPPRPQNNLIHRAKQILKRILGIKKSMDLYSLQDWTAFD